MKKTSFICLEDGTLRDCEDVYWAGTDINVDGLKVTLTYRWEP